MQRFPLYLIVMCIALAATLAAAQENPPENPQASASDGNLVVSAARVHKDGQSFYELHASGVVRATPKQTWKVLTNYGDMYQFVPNLAASKLVSRNDQETIVEQKWVKRILFFSYNFDLVIRATEHPLSSIDITLVSGEMKQYFTHWEFTPIGPDGTGGTRITYYGKIEPDLYMPPFFGTSVMQSDLKKMMSAVLTKIDQ